PYGQNTHPERNEPFADLCNGLNLADVNAHGLFAYLIGFSNGFEYFDYTGPTRAAARPRKSDRLA
ncbi:MAG: hypothetical protein ACRD7E_10195, partial [Bryobacteraceae bacterium]